MRSLRTIRYSHEYGTFDYRSRTSSKSYLLHTTASNAHFYIYTYNVLLAVKDHPLPDFTINLLPKPDSNHVLADVQYKLDQQESVPFLE